MPVFPCLCKTACPCLLALLSILPLAYGIVAFRHGPFLDQLVLRGRLKRHHDPGLSRDDPLVPDIGRNRDPPLGHGRRRVTCEEVRTPSACWPSLKIAGSPVRHHALVAVGVP